MLIKTIELKMTSSKFNLNNKSILTDILLKLSFELIKIYKIKESMYINKADKNLR